MIKLISYKSIIKYNGQTIDEINNARMAESQQNNADYIAYAERQGQPTPIFIPLTKLQREYQIKKAMVLYYKPIGKLIKEYEARKLTLLHTDTDAILYKEPKNDKSKK